MRKLLLAVTAFMLIAASFTSVSAQVWKFNSTQRIASTHDGNGFDEDDVGASAFVWAITWAFGAAPSMCHFEHSNNLAGASATGGKTSQYLMMIESSVGGAKNFGLGEGTGYGTTGIVYDFVKDPTATVAHFKIEAEKLTETNQIVFICAGPMESLWRDLSATPLDLRKYITPISHSNWNETFTRAGNGMVHSWAACKALPGGAKFVDISDQNGNLGTGKNGDWSQVKTVGTKNGKTQANWDWLFNRIVTMAKQGDVSDCGMAYYAFTGNQKGGGTELMKIFNDPKTPQLPPGGTYTAPSSIANKTGMNKSAVSVISKPHQIIINLSESQADGTIKIYDMMNKLVCTAPLSSGCASMPSSRLAKGSYVLKIQTGQGSFIKNFVHAF